VEIEIAVLCVEVESTVCWSTKYSFMYSAYEE